MIITEQNYVEKAQKVMEKEENGRKKVNITTSKIRNLLAMTADIYNEVLNHPGDKLTEEIIGRINYLKIHFVYEAGREPAVKTLVEQAKILEIIDEIQGSKKNYVLFSKYMEALVAYHRYYGGRD